MNYIMFDKVSDILTPYYNLTPKAVFNFVGENQDGWQFYIFGEGMTVEVKILNTIIRNFSDPELQSEALVQLKELIFGTNNAIVMARTTESNSHIFTLAIEYKTVNISQHFRFNHKNTNIQKWLNQVTATYMKFDINT